MTLRSKLLLAQSPLLCGLVALGAVGSVTISRLGRGAEAILHDNYRSVLAAQGMKEAVERIDSAAMFFVAGRPDKGAPQERENRARFERALRDQSDNITEGGEREATDQLRARWDDYRARLEKFHALSDGEAQRADYFAELEPAFLAVKQADDEVLAINQRAMAAKSDAARHTAARADTLLLSSALLLLVVAFIASATFTTRLLRPLAVLSHALERLGQGDPQARARLDGSDEVATLARDFDTMADRLERYRKSSLGELLLAQSATQAAIDGLPDPVMILTADGGLLSANRASETLLGITTDGPPFAATDPALREALERVRAHVAAGKGAWLPAGLDDAIRLASPSGDRHFLPRAAPLPGEAGQLAGVTIVLSEVTRLLRFDQLKNDLVATVAHEFRTPLTSLRMALHLCTEGAVGPLTPKQAELLVAARDDCERLQTIVADLLDLSRIQSGRLELERRPLPVEDLLRAASDGQRARAAERRIDLVHEPAGGELFADGDRLRLVLDNLLSNALRHSPEGGRVVLRARRSPAAIRIEVSDGGSGIPRDYQAAIFEKFFRLPGAPPGGAGLGLYIAKEIVAAHGGTIGVDSDGEHGSTFWISLPA